VHVSNTLGCINPVQEIAIAHQYGESINRRLPKRTHMPIDVQKMDCDWLVASGHKMCAPTGIGFCMASWLCCGQCLRFGGGEMIADVF